MPGKLIDKLTDAQLMRRLAARRGPSSSSAVRRQPAKATPGSAERVAALELTRKQTTASLAGAVYTDILAKINSTPGSGFEELAKSANDAIVGVFRGMEPRDAVEEQLVMQLAVQHGRVMHLAARAHVQPHLKWFDTMNAAVDRAMNTYRRMALALQAYRQPRAPITVTGGQNNIAGQQIIQQNGTHHENASNEQGFPPTVPAHVTGAAVIEAQRVPGEAVAPGDGPTNAGGQVAGVPERLEARPAVRRRPAGKTRGHRGDANGSRRPRKCGVIKRPAVAPGKDRK